MGAAPAQSRARPHGMDGSSSGRGGMGPTKGLSTMPTAEFVIVVIVVLVIVALGVGAWLTARPASTRRYTR